VPKPKAQAKKQAKKTATVNSDDEANGDEEEGDAEGEDQVDEYKCLRTKRNRLPSKSQCALKLTQD